MDPHRVLIATVTAGGGHLQAARALETAWREHRPADSVQTVDLLDLVPRLQRQLYIQTYVNLVEHAPELWGMVFKKTDDPALVQRWSRFRRQFAQVTNRRFVSHVAEFNPQAVVCTHYLPVEIMGHLKQGGSRAFTVSVVTDFEAHSLWMDPHVDLYCVAAEATRSSLTARGADASRVAVTGIPIAPKFSTPLRRLALRKQLALRHDLPVLLVLSGGFGMGPVAEILDALKLISRPLQVLVVCGRNEELRQQLATRDYRHATRVLGFVDDMHHLMAAADLVLTKPGGLTTSEALALGRPLFILNPIPGQESANSDFLLERGAAVKVNRIEDLPFRLAEILDSSKLRGMARAAKRLGHPDSAISVCVEVIRRRRGGGPPAVD
jgi:processive 1,2-diacylglycerol beta-glucosyltransferase